ncbi:hypothetical protein Cgig2_004780 [Carnegiea gigantea]|uniref:Uncharacterized protein n=1 Tax=Carnegiea gigantea TaxID=171969 RepID=A0A9Q1KVI0_9CARY|nr:hypothetical protein Cgig2_004780 [Carnegiea gigantea]
MSCSENSPKKKLSLAMGVCPSYTVNSTSLCLSEEVVSLLTFFVGRVVFLGITMLILPLFSSIPRDKGVTSLSTSSLVKCSSICNCLIWIQTFAEWLPMEEVLQHLLNLRNTTIKQVQIHLLKSSTCSGIEEINAFIKAVDLNSSLRSGRKNSLCPLASSPQPPKSSRTSAYIFVVYPLKLSSKVANHPAVKINPAKVGVPIYCSTPKHTLSNGDYGDIKSTTT